MFKSSILIVDDEPLNLQLSAECLHADYAIRLARSGEEAVAYLEKNLIDLILLDINMTGIDGFETAKRIKNLSSHSNTPIIYLTADTSEDTIARAFDSGAADYITKPFRQKELLARVKNRIETEWLKNEQIRLNTRNEHLMQIIKTHIAYIKTSTTGVITEVSQNFCELFQPNCEDFDACINYLLGQNINLLKSGYTDKKIYRKLWETIRKGETFTHDIEDRNFNNGTNWYRITVTPDKNEAGVIAGYIAFYHNIDDKVQFEHDAHTDFLTGLHNRSRFEKSLLDEIVRFKRYNAVFSLILTDIDHFKLINDTFGHAIGDYVLKEVADILSANIRQSDILARWGGEEFILLCPHTDLHGASVLAETLRDKMQTHSFDYVGHCTASFGVVQISDPIAQDEIFLKVDHALYKAKQAGRNRVVSV